MYRVLLALLFGHLIVVYMYGVCAVEIDECASFPCQNNGFCMDFNGFYECNCPAEVMGLHCEMAVPDFQTVPDVQTVSDDQTTPDFQTVPNVQTLMSDVQPAPDDGQMTTALDA